MRKVKLSNCGNYILSPKISSNDLTCENYITTDNMLPNKAGVVDAENVPQNISVTQYLKNDILLSNIRPYFKKIWLAEFNGGCSADVLVFRTSSDYDSTYIKYCLSQDSFFAYDMAGSKGSKMPRGDKNHILNFELFDYDLKTQKDIGNLLLSIDKKIKLNDKINLELENIAKTLYDYWFVQFDFPDENERPYKSSGGAMVYNEVLKREIPVNWANGTLSDISNTQTGYAFKSSEWKEEGHPVLTIKVIENNSVNMLEASYIENYKEKYEKYSVNNGNIILAMTGNTIGKIGIIASDIKNILINQRVCIYKTNYTDIAYLYFNLLSEGIQNKIWQIGQNSSQPNIIEEQLKQLPIVLPPKELLNKYNKISSHSFAKIVNNNIENQQLSKLRDFLLPMLMNGQVTIQ